MISASDMNQKETKNDGRTRNIKDGPWYWIHKAVIRNHAVDIRAVSVAVYNCLAAMADKKQECFPSQQYIARTIGYSRATVNRALKVLIKHGLIAIRKKGQYRRVYRLLAVSCNTGETQMLHRCNPGVKKFDTNKNQITKINNDNIVSVKKFDISLLKNSEGKEPKTRTEILATDIAAALKDQDHLYRYLALANRYPEHVLRQLLSEAKQVPDSRIKKSRAALFNYLLKKHVQETSHDSGDQSRN